MIPDMIPVHTMHLRRVWNSLKHLLSDHAGSSVTEYSLILALIAGSLVFGLEAVRFFDGADHLTAHLSGQSSSGMGELHRQATSSVTAGGATTDDAVDPMLGLRIIVLGLLVTTVMLALVVSRKRRKAEAAQQLVEASQAVQKQHDQARFVAKRQEILRTLSKDVRFLMESHVDVQKVMSRRVLTVYPYTTYDEVALLMKENHVRHLLVTNGQQELLGVISDRDVARSSGGSAQSIMTANPACVALTTPIRNAISMMLDRHISCLPVVDEGRAVGILTTTDLTMMLQCALQLLDQLDITVKTPPAPAAESLEIDDEALVGASI